MRRAPTRGVFVGCALVWAVGALGCPREQERSDEEVTAPATPSPPRPAEDQAALPAAHTPSGPRLALGAAHTCVLEPHGAVRCWGANRFGQLGSGDVPAGSGAHRSTPVTVDGLSDAIDVAAGSFHTCAVRRGGDVVCWGHGAYGLGGDGRLGGDDVPVPRAVEGVGGAVALAAGDGFTCALRASGDVVCWGRNDLGQLGRGAAGEPGGVAEVAGLSDVQAVAAGARHACALTKGAVRCWGMAVDGQIGPGVKAGFTATPVAIALPEPAEALAAGGYHTCVVVAGRAHCLGANDSGQLGIGAGGRPDDRRARPAPMSGVRGVRAVAAGGRFTCVRHGEGAVACAGYNGSGQLGDGTTSLRRTPVEVVSLGEVRSLEAGAAHVCAVHPGGEVACWGRNAAGQLGDGTTENRPRPVAPAP
jgi:alpha-tubulin suppressor-like RCC1 family protein